VHPEVVNCYLEGTLVKTLKQKIRKELRDDIAQLRPEEAATLVLLQTRLARQSPKRPSAAPST
jgi:DNA topoisomerase-1